MSDIINVSSLKKSYGRKTVLDDISFTLKKGEIVGLLGPNGCGKTTLMKILTGLIKDNEGEVLINGSKPGAYTKSIVAYLPDKSYLPDWMRPVDAADYFADFYSDFDKNKALRMFEGFGIDIKQRLKTMSKGQQEKVNLVLVICRKAQVYILDEPLGGLDPASRSAVLDLIMKNYAEDATVLISTHLINDVERIFSRVLMINDGKLLVNSETQSLKKDGKSVEDIFKEVFINVFEAFKA